MTSEIIDVHCGLSLNGLGHLEHHAIVTASTHTAHMPLMPVAFRNMHMQYNIKLLVKLA